MTDNVSKKVRRKTMKAVKSENTSLEKSVTKELWRRGFRFRKNVKDLYGKPDIAIKKYKVAIFIDSCFWHGCKLHCRMPDTNKEYWVKKINRNKKRDQEVTDYYQKKGWNILRIWEHEINYKFEQTINKISDFIEKAKKEQ